jgi:hypothetical protein
MTIKPSLEEKNDRQSGYRKRDRELYQEIGYTEDYFYRHIDFITAHTGHDDPKSDKRKAMPA